MCATAGLQQLARPRIERPARVERAGQPGGRRAVRVQRQLLPGAVGRRQQGEDADRPGDRGRVGDDLVADVDTQ